MNDFSKETILTHLSFGVLTHHSVHFGSPPKILQEISFFTGMDHVASTWSPLYNLKCFPKIYPPVRQLNSGLNE